MSKFNVGDIVCWFGNNPIVARIVGIERESFFGHTCWKLNKDSHDSCSEKFLRLATDDEVIKYYNDHPEEERDGSILLTHLKRDIKQLIDNMAQTVNTEIKMLQKHIRSQNETISRFEKEKQQQSSQILSLQQEVDNLRRENTRLIQNQSYNGWTEIKDGKETDYDFPLNHTYWQWRTTERTNYVCKTPLGIFKAKCDVKQLPSDCIAWTHFV